MSLSQHMCACVLGWGGLSLSHVQVFVIPWNVATQDVLSLGILQAGMLEWIVAIPFSSGSSQPRDQTWKILYRLSHQGSSYKKKAM